MSDGIFYKITMAIIALFFVIALLTALSGCRALQPITDAIFGIERPPVVEQTPTNSLWQTVKKAKSNWITTLAIPIIALGAVAMFNGAAKLGMSAIIFGSVNLFMSLATSRFSLIMAVFGLVGSGLAVAVSILGKNKALKEIICGVQEVKDIAKEDNIDLVFQDKVKEVLQKQVTSTKKIVQNVKNKLKLKGEM